MKKNVTKMSKRIIGLVAAAVMSVSMLAVGGMTASAAAYDCQSPAITVTAPSGLCFSGVEECKRYFRCIRL